MKKITILFVLLSFCAFSFAQDAAKTMELNRSAKKSFDLEQNYIEKKQSSQKNIDYVLNEGFDIWPPEGWTIIDGPQSQGTQQWHQAGEEPNFYANISWDDDGDATARPQDEWLITPIVTVPVDGLFAFKFTSNPYWVIDPNDNADLRVLISTDEGENWIEIWNEEDYDSWEFGDWVEIFISLTEYEGDDVQFAFNYVGEDACWWSVDDVQVYSVPEYDLIMTDARMNFIDYIDYNVEGQESYFHYSSHYGMIPTNQYDSPHALSWFNVTVENRGYETINPVIDVEIMDPSDNVIFVETIIGPALASSQRDTIDIIENAFELGADPELGRYTVHYTATIEGQETIELGENTMTASFVVTEYTMSRDADNITGTTGPANWVSGGNDGDMIGTNFIFLYEEEIHSMDVFIADNSDIGTAFMGRIMVYDSGSEDWVDLTTSTLITVEEEHLGEWVNVEFIDQAFVTFPDGDDAMSIKAAIEFYYQGEENDLWIGYDRSNTHSIWSASWYFTDGANANQWFSITNWTNAGGLGIRLNTGYDDDDESFVEGIDSHNINVYPNPTTGVLNIDNVQGANIEVMNLMGQTVQTVSNANEFNTVDMSNYANGTYIVRIVKDGNVITQKVNLIN